MSDPALEQKGKETQYAEKIDFSKLPTLPSLHCPDCGGVLSVDGIDAEHNRINCTHCHHSFGLQYDSSSNDIVPYKLAPAGMEIFQLAGQIEVDLKWSKSLSTFSRSFFFLFSGLWNVILLPVAISLLLSGNAATLLFLSLHLMVGIGTFLYAISTVVNKTKVTVNKDEIRISTGPLNFPWVRDTIIPADEINQLYVSRYTIGSVNGDPRYAFGLYAIAKDGKTTPLIKGMNLETQRYLEAEFERFLGIKNQKIASEYK